MPGGSFRFFGVDAKAFLSGSTHAPGRYEPPGGYNRQPNFDPRVCLRYPAYPLLTNLTNRTNQRTIEAVVGVMEAAMAATQVNLYEAKTHLSSLVERAAKGEEIVIAKAGKPMARLSPMTVEEKAPQPLRKFGQNLLGITFLADDWEKDIPLEYFQDEGEENPFGGEAVVTEAK